MPQYCAKVLQTKLDKFLPVRVKFHKISCEKFQCLTIFRATFHKVKRKIAISKIRAATNKFMSTKKNNKLNLFDRKLPKMERKLIKSLEVPNLTRELYVFTSKDLFFGMSRLV